MEALQLKGKNNLVFKTAFVHQASAVQAPLLPLFLAPEFSSISTQDFATSSSTMMINPLKRAADGNAFAEFPFESFYSKRLQMTNMSPYDMSSYQTPIQLPVPADRKFADLINYL
jgi:hypothetical protein